jgi:hypothetical protein
LLAVSEAEWAARANGLLLQSLAHIRGDCDWGSDTIMTEAEQRGIDYLFKLRKSPFVKKLILQQHCKPGREKTHAGLGGIIH